MKIVVEKACYIGGEFKKKGDKVDISESEGFYLVAKEMAKETKAGDSTGKKGK